MPAHYPFSAVLGCDPEHPDGLGDMGLALILTTVSPEIGGVLVRGEKGTAKSTAVRALAAVLPPIDVVAGDRFSTDPHDQGSASPDGPFPADAPVETRPVRLVELPIGATEDRVLGSLHLERALTHGKVEYDPGLLARAHRGVLYVDEVNLLHDHLVDLLLDAAAMGRATVERDGVSVEYAARFVLIGTMNPEEGELRPQLLDRFGLTAEIAAPRDPRRRAEVVRRRIAYDADPGAFAERYRAADAALTERIAAARRRVGEVGLGEPALLKIAEVCAAFEVDGLRADIVTARAAVAHAAWEGRDAVTRADIRRAALLTLPHRRRRKPFDAPGLDEDLLDRLLGDAEPPPPPTEGPEAPDDPGPQGAPEGPGTPAPEEAPPPHGEAPAPERGTAPGDDAPRAPAAPTDADADADADVDPRAVPAATPYRPRLLTVRGLGDGAAGRRSRALAGVGTRIGARPADGAPGSLHLVETLRAAAAARPARGPAGGRVPLRAEDLRHAVREGREANLVMFCVDASGSMAARRRMTQVKTAVLSLLLDAYRRRDKVGLVTFRGRTAELALPPTRSVEIAALRLDELPAGGRTPLAEGLLQAARTLRRERLRDPRLRPLLVVVTDGRATGGPDAVARSRLAAEHVAALGVTSVVIDGETGPLRLGLAADLARRLGAEHLPVAEVSADVLAGSVRDRTGGPSGLRGAA
ncbi:VWA domain-containing protein [Streptomyces sp. PT12]|uniref:VWA domain-containing protein n=1 Tax=Streptomyces sp. PT12 TaxID=1510197 RepID=UPI000DE41D6C|nr:VWA domain-containing protein [Streptomyces sp. PT12]RBM17549.1 magnesium chelatase [Streptomyces sp. PT12]